MKPLFWRYRCRQLFDLMQQYPRMAKLYVRCLHQALEFQNEINIKRLYLPGNKRYEWFCKKWPEVDQIASNQQIASFSWHSLRISQQTAASKKEASVRDNLYCFRNSDIDCAWMPIFVEIFGVPVRRLSTPILVLLCYSL